MQDEARLNDARRLKSAARDIIATDIATLRRSLAERSVLRRVRDRVFDAAAQVVEDGAALANENRVATGLTVTSVVASVAGWVWRAPLTRLARRLLKRG